MACLLAYYSDHSTDQAMFWAMLASSTPPPPQLQQRSRTETRAHNIILLGPLAHRQVISQTELLIAVVAAEGLVAVCSLVHGSGLLVLVVVVVIAKEQVGRE